MYEPAQLGDSDVIRDKDEDECADVVDVDDVLDVYELVEELSEIEVEDRELLIDDVGAVALVPRLAFLISYLPVACVRRLQSVHCS